MLPDALIGCSWKAFMGATAATYWLDAVASALGRDARGANGVFACVPYPLVIEAVRALGPLGGLVGSQDVSRFPPGAYTGEVSAQLLADIGCRFAMAGHPERAQLLSETLGDVAEKAAAAAATGLVPLLVVGESEHLAQPIAVVREQLNVTLAGVPSAAAVVVAYEPRWAIGQAEPAPAAHVAGVVGELNMLLAEREGPFRVLYGGSAGPGTFSAIVKAARDIGSTPPDGVFLGRAGLDVKAFLATVREVRESHDGRHKWNAEGTRR